MKTCIRCGESFEPIEKWKDRQKVCSACVIEAIEDMAAEAVFHMTDEEIEQELREDGVDVEAFKAKVAKMVDEAFAKRKGGA